MRGRGRSAPPPHPPTASRRAPPSPAEGRGAGSAPAPKPRRRSEQSRPLLRSRAPRIVAAMSRTSPSSPPNKCATPLMSSRSPSDPSTSTNGDQRSAQRASRCSSAESPGGIGGNRDEAGIERTRVGQPCAGTCAALGGGCGHRMDDQPVRAFDSEDDRRPSTSLRTGVRLATAAFRPTLDRQMRQPDGKHPCHARGSSGRAACLSRGTARRPTPEFRARAGRAR